MAARKPAPATKRASSPNPSSLAEDRLRRLREICLALPEASEKIAWGDPTFRVRDRIFVMQKGNYAGGRPSIWLKVREGGQSLLLASKRELCFVPPYVGHKGWIGVYLDGRSVPWSFVGELIAESHSLVAPRRSARKPAPRRRA
jgi:predicted DNA-binding protein (MmcQ/YjbR family)